MRQSPSAPACAKKPARVPSPDRATAVSAHPEEGPAPHVAGASSRAAVPPEFPPSSFFPPAFDWTDAEDALSWLAAVRGAADDLATLAHEGGRRLRHRVFSRAEIRRQTRAAERWMRGLLAEAEAGLELRRRARK